MKIPLSNPDITKKERDAVLGVLKTPHLSLGPKLPEFEQVMAGYAGVKYAVAMSSGTAVLHCIIKALGIGKGDLVLTTPFSFISTSNCLLFEGAEPIFVDIDENTYNLTPEAVEKAYLALPEEKRQKVKAVSYVDVFGVPADGYGFEALGKQYGLHIIDDSAEALGSSLKGRKCGSFGDAGLFAFYPNKQITTGEGGVLLTGNKDLAMMAKSLRNQGRDEGAGWLQHARLGYNYRISDINCALGIAQVQRIDEILSKRKKVKAIYDTRFEQLFTKGVLIPQHIPVDCEVSPFVYVLRLAGHFTKEDREKLLESLRAKGIGCSNYFTPIHLQPHYRELGWQYGDMPITERISERTIALPFFNNLSEVQIKYVVKAVSEFFLK
ncbi:MAG TPA: DegT/DnrJ/EryC1/StrS family aminotransferase [Candidatus Deferrimicrobium sp.]|nr:DegT/DnrJ/EryC1/StrS family aminotransferase [Candidatus Kapabacteria bacterium]HLP59533.1 DegT/DnrJ/EryC1/StrS family aminotransferase [Candidatus Deferrimicrobium sp.]